VNPLCAGSADRAVSGQKVLEQPKPAGEAAEAKPGEATAKPKEIPSEKATEKK
jgi:hypothetical protein